MNPANRQDVQNVVETARNRIMERMVTKQDIILLSDTIKNLTALVQQSQQMLKQSEYQRSQLIRRVVSLETRIVTFENEVRSLSSAVMKVAQQRPQQIIMPVQPTQADQPALQQQAAQYAYRPN